VQEGLVHIASVATSPRHLPQQTHIDEALHEIFAVGRAEGAKLEEHDIDRVIDQFSRVPYDAPTSMWLDFKAGKKSELEQLTGYVVEKAAEHGIEVPTMRRCYEKLHAKAVGGG